MSPDTSDVPDAGEADTGITDAVDNPFFTPSDLPYALPPFDRITEANYRR